MGIFDEHFGAEAKLIPDQIEILGIINHLAVRLLTLQSLHAPEAALTTRGHGTDPVLAVVDDVILPEQGKERQSKASSDSIDVLVRESGGGVLYGVVHFA